jgi:HNH endonuclease
MPVSSSLEAAIMREAGASATKCHHRNRHHQAQYVIPVETGIQGFQGTPAPRWSLPSKPLIGGQERHLFNFSLHSSSTSKQIDCEGNPMAQGNDRLDKVVLEARRNADKRAAGYRDQALKLFPWVCGRCARTFTHANLQLLEVHHKNSDHEDNPPDGSNWELLCTYCHEHEHSKIKDSAGRTDTKTALPGATFNPFADLKAKLESKKRT